ncbi:amidohydrolase family protein [Sphingomonas sp. RB56-2]|uniref:Amidohydrolase family protein n=1 Tax=Sphingomonas brevis TaxID=2908206 RepID=A0ABT0S9Q7_9SPHN|nr:amidohydrolase family protein [Sphingomonas brevis]MCL6740811.1 amidohydrolase family protein [Sphingomonas brevis]
MTVRRALVALCLAVSPVALAAAPVPKEQLLVPPAGADHYVVVSEAGKHGDEWRWTLPDGGIAYRESILLRGLVFEQDEVVKLDATGKPVSFTVRGVTPSGDSAETFAIDQATAHWKTTVDEGQAPAGQGTYNTFGGTFLAGDATIPLFLKAGAAGVALLPSGHGTLERSATAFSAVGPNGPRTANLYFFKGIGQSPAPVWLFDDGKIFGFVGALALMPEGYEANLKPMIAAQEAAIAELAPAIAKRLLTAETMRPVLFRNVKIYDADKERFVTGQNVVVSDGKIASVGTALPKLAAGARVIDGAGKTLVPGLWDSHMHVSDDFNALSEVALGVTSARNPGGSIELAVSQRERRAKGLMVGPEQFNSVIIDQKGPLAAQGSLTVSSLEETLAAVRKIKAANLTAVKFYTSMNPAWIPPAAKLAHELGLHVHGHIPAGMRTLDAVNAGYDEITHIYFATMQAMPDEIVAKSNTTLRMTGPGKYFKDVDFNAEPTRTVIRTLAERKITVDPTLVVVEGTLTSEAGKVSPAYSAYVGTLPPAVERGFKSGPIPLPEGTTRDEARASVKHMLEYVAVMRKAGVPIVAGTDGQGTELVRELELYVAGGMTPAEALATATIDAARNVKADKRTGSIAVGKEADLLLVDGDPEANIGDLRHVDKVVLDGALLDGDELRKEAGFSGRPK